MIHRSAKDFEENFDELFLLVLAGKTIVITSNDTGEPIAEFAPIQEIEDE